MSRINIRRAMIKTRILAAAFLLFCGALPEANAQRGFPTGWQTQGTPPAAGGGAQSLQADLAGNWEQNGFGPGRAGLQIELRPAGRGYEGRLFTYEDNKAAYITSRLDVTQDASGKVLAIRTDPDGKRAVYDGVHQPDLRPPYLNLAVTNPTGGYSGRISVRKVARTITSDKWPRRIQIGDNAGRSSASVSNVADLLWADDRSAIYENVRGFLLVRSGAGFDLAQQADGSVTLDASERALLRQAIPAPFFRTRLNNLSLLAANATVSDPVYRADPCNLNLVAVDLNEDAGRFTRTQCPSLFAGRSTTPQIAVCRRAYADAKSEIQYRDAFEACSGVARERGYSQRDPELAEAGCFLASFYEEGLGRQVELGTAYALYRVHEGQNAMCREGAVRVKAERDRLARTLLAEANAALAAGDAAKAQSKFVAAYGRGSAAAALRMSELYRNGTFDRNNTPAGRAEQAIYWQYRAAGAGSGEAFKVVQADLARRRKKVTDDGKIGADSCRARKLSETRRVRDGVLMGPSVAQQRAYCIARVNDAMMSFMGKIDEDERRMADELSGRVITAN